MAVRGPRGAEIETAPEPERSEVKKAIRAGELDDHDPIANRRYVERLDRILRSGLASRRGHDDRRARGIEDEEVVVVCRASQRIRPEEVRASASRRDRVVVEAAEVVKPPGLASGERRSHGSSVHEVSFPRFGGALVLAAVVAGGAEVEGAGGGHIIDGLSNDAAMGGGHHTGRLPLLKRALHGWVKDVIDDDVAPRRPQVVDVLSEGRGAGDARRVIELREGRHVIDDLQHRRAFVSGPGLTGQDGHPCGQVFGRLESGQRVHAV